MHKLTIHNKAVRDKIPDIIDSDGRKCTVKTLSDSEFLIELEKKLDEEVAEFHQNKDVAELADILEVVYRLAALHGTSADSLDAIRNEKASKNGAFEKNLFLVDCE